MAQLESIGCHVNITRTQLSLCTHKRMVPLEAPPPTSPHRNGQGGEYHADDEQIKRHNN